MDRTIKTLIKMLDLQKRSDLSALLVHSKTDVLVSTQYGSRYNSLLSTILVYFPPEEYVKIKSLSKTEHDLILKTIQEIYPPTDEEPEISRLEFRILTDEIAEPEVQKTDGGFIEKSVRLFISYSSETEAAIAGMLKKLLELYFGIDVFLAHEDIEGAKEWEKEIIENLNRTDIFVPLLSDGFTRSQYADQEVGAACAKHKLIVPVSIDKVVPYGFIRKIQAIKLHFDPNAADAYQWLILCEEIVSAIFRDGRYTQSTRNLLIRAFSLSRNFRMSQRFVPLLEKYGPYDQTQVNNIITAIIENNQIHLEAFAIPQFSIGFIEKYKSQIDSKQLKELYKTPIFVDQKSNP